MLPKTDRLTCMCETADLLPCSKPYPELPDSSEIQRAIKATSQKMETCRVTTLGSLLRCGGRG